MKNIIPMRDIIGRKVKEETMSIIRNTLAIVVLFILASCGTSTPAATATLTPVHATPTPSQQAALPTRTRPNITSPSYRLRIRINTTSDWTTFRLTGGGYWYDFNVTSASTQAQSAGLEGDSIILSQSVGQAQGGKSVELVVEALLTDLEPANPLTFEIERGYIGSTQVEISSYTEETPTVVAVLTWDGINAGKTNNAQAYEVSPQPFLGATPNEYIVIGQLNFWYYGPGQYGGFENADGSRVTPLTPLLGETYYASDPSVVYQQIEWAIEYGVDAFSIEWTTPRGVGCCGSMEDTLDDVFLKSPNINKVRWAIFYDFPLRLMQTPDLNVNTIPNINFDQPDVYNTFVSDFVHFGTKYFGNPQYLTIDGRPVIYIWATNSFIGNLAGAMQEARNQVAELGYDVFIVGDEVCIGCFNQQHAALFDGSSTFTMLMPGLDSAGMVDVGKAAVMVDGAFQWWTDRIAGLKVAGREDLVNFQPAWAPQYDERYWIFDHPTYVPAQSKDQVIEMATVARKYAEPVGSSGLKLIWLNTWNNWAETTTVEPTANLGSKYPAGNYQFDMLEVVREVFGSETYYTSPVP
jgi:hypothetical protein